MTSADLSGLAHGHARGQHPDRTHEEMMAVVRATIDAAPRSQQTVIGPSELGTPCARRLGHRLTGTPEVNRRTAWKPTVGTAVHTWLEDAFTQANAGQPARWLTEMRVAVGDVAGVSIEGTCDLYDLHTCTVVDFKILGAASLKDKRLNGPGEQYRTQVHLYGRGFAQRGLPVDTVGILGLPQNGDLHDAWWWTEPYDEQIAVDALTRADAVAAFLALNPGQVGRLPTADAWCSSCPWHLPAATELHEACPGHVTSATTAATNPTRPTAA